MARQALPIPRCSERRGLPKGTPSRKRRCFRACGYWGISVLPASSPLRPLRPPRFLLLSGAESTAEDAEDAEEKRECERATHYHSTTNPGGSPRRKVALSCVIIFSLALIVRLLYWQDASAEIARGDSTIQALAATYRDEAKRMLEQKRVLFPRDPIDPGDAR